MGHSSGLQVKNVSYNYHTEEGITEAIREVSFNVNEGDLVSIVGPSGCGKTTLLNIICGLIKNSSGEILYEGKVIEKPEDVFGYMFQQDNLFPWLSVFENIKLGLKIKKQLTSENLLAIEELMKKYNLQEFKTYYPNQLSGGMRQRVALIRTLAIRPKILLLDEPFSALDYHNRIKICKDIFNIIKEEKKTAIMVTHDISEAVSCSNKIIVLSKRPSTMKRILTLDFDAKLSSMERRKSSEFNKYFELVWEEFDEDE